MRPGLRSARSRRISSAVRARPTGGPLSPPGHHEMGLEGLVVARLGDHHDGVDLGALGEALDQLPSALSFCAGAAGRGQDQACGSCRRPPARRKLEQDAGRSGAGGRAVSLARVAAREQDDRVVRLPGRVRSTLRSSTSSPSIGRLDRLLAERCLRRSRRSARRRGPRPRCPPSLPGSATSPEGEHIAGELGRSRGVELERAGRGLDRRRARPGARTPGRSAPRAQE